MSDGFTALEMAVFTVLLVVGWIGAVWWEHRPHK